MSTHQSETTHIATNLEICRVLNGMWQVSGAHGHIDPDEAVENMFSYIDTGFTTWDLADHYGPAEDFIGEFRRRLVGRRGSDATAVALAAALGADVCEIYTDVEGVFTSDPRIVKNAKLIKEITYEEMLEMSSSGAKVLMARSVEFGRRYNVPIKVSSTFMDNEGTLVKDKVMEEAIISGVTHNDKEIKFTLFGVPDQPGVAAKVFKPLSEVGVNVDMIVQNVSKDNKSDISFTTPSEQLVITEKTLEPLINKLGAEGLNKDEDVARVSLIGAGMKSESGIAAKMFETLGREKINIDMISTSPIRISCVISKDNVEKALKSLHTVFIETK